MDAQVVDALCVHDSAIYAGGYATNSYGIEVPGYWTLKGSDETWNKISCDFKGEASAIYVSDTLMELAVTYYDGSNG